MSFEPLVGFPIVTPLFAMSNEFLIFVIGAVVALLLTIYAIVRLFLFKPESIVVLSWVLVAFSLGFLGPFLGKTPYLILGATFVLGVMLSSLAIGRLSKSGWSAFLAGAVLVPLTLIAAGYGVYEARATGWQNLKPLGQASDHPGIETVWFWFFTGIMFWAVPALLSGVIAAWAHSRRNSGRPGRAEARKPFRKSESKDQPSP